MDENHTTNPTAQERSPLFHIIVICVISFATIKLYQWLHPTSKKNSKGCPTDSQSNDFSFGWFVSERRLSHASKILAHLGMQVNTWKSEAILDRFTNLDEVTEAVRAAGLESSNLIFGIDYTKSNFYAGKRTFTGKCLHSIEGNIRNPYQQVISILGRTLAPFDDDGLIPVYGFGDLATQDKKVFPFRADGFCHGFQDVLDCYTQITPSIVMSGPTDFSPLIRESIRIVEINKAYHILVIIADGQVTAIKRTRDAIVEAAHFPLSIIMVGVGDGPWDDMKAFDDNLPKRKFDNFQFVEFNEIMSLTENHEPSFALNALMEIPDQFMEIRRLGYLDN